ncbi:hypothetical protein Y1Q_0000059 [Alligator mississippiensis]|uniref:Uncharacterized protein n=1 Tax=Alligator mississippiensis TaxID=8496 RepID=A0A151NTW6_ALLMI|nr:hypothetical protein Y1Q_0000059 [Alligator mississippiensis]
MPKTSTPLLHLRGTWKQEEEVTRNPAEPCCWTANPRKPWGQEEEEATSESWLATLLAVQAAVFCGTKCQQVTSHASLVPYCDITVLNMEQNLTPLFFGLM